MGALSRGNEADRLGGSGLLEEFGCADGYDGVLAAYEYGDGSMDGACAAYGRDNVTKLAGVLGDERFLERAETIDVAELPWVLESYLKEWLETGDWRIETKE